MTAMIAAALVWIAAHAGLAGPLRPALAARLGENGFRAFFSVVSVGALAFLILAYRAAPPVQLWQFGPGGRHLAMLLMLVAAILFAGAASPRNPTAMAPIDGEVPIVGITRITRHPMLCAFALWAIAHLLANGDAAGACLFAAILITAINGMFSIDRKLGRRHGAAYGTFCAKTSRLPFLAILQRRQRLALGELIRPVAIGIALYAVLLFAHPWIAGRVLIAF